MAIIKRKLRAACKTEEPDLVKKQFEQMKAKVCVGDSPEGRRKDEMGDLQGLGPDEVPFPGYLCVLTLMIGHLWALFPKDVICNLQI